MLQYSFNSKKANIFPALFRLKRPNLLFFHVKDVNDNVRGNKKGISGNGPAPCIPPVIRRHRKTVSPRKRSSGPLDGGFQCKASCGSLILSRDSPDSVISGPEPLMPEKRIAPPLVVTISCAPARRKRENASKRGKNRPLTHFFRGGQICWSSFAAPMHPQSKEKPHPETVSGCGEILLC